MVLYNYPYFLKKILKKYATDSQEKHLPDFEFIVFPSPKPDVMPILEFFVGSILLPIAGEKIYWFIPFLRALARCKMQIILSRLNLSLRQLVWRLLKHYVTCISDRAINQWIDRWMDRYRFIYFSINLAKIMNVKLSKNLQPSDR